MGKNNRFGERHEFTYSGPPEEAVKAGEFIQTTQKDFIDLPVEEQIRMDEAVQSTHKEVMEALKKGVSERPKGLSKGKNADNSVQNSDISVQKTDNLTQKTVGTEPKLVKTPFGDGYFVYDLPENRFNMNKITFYRGRLFVLKDDLELKNS